MSVEEIPIDQGTAQEGTPVEPEEAVEQRPEEDGSFWKSRLPRAATGPMRADPGPPQLVCSLAPFRTHMCECVGCMSLRCGAHR